jgi:hypothetical protein
MKNDKLLVVIFLLAGFVLVNNVHLLKHFKPRAKKVMKTIQHPLDDLDDNTDSVDSDSNGDRNYYTNGDNHNHMTIFPNKSPNVTFLPATKHPSADASNPVIPLIKQKPWMIIHVGPPKTATTTIQSGLNRNSPRLAGTDNIFYIGTTYLNLKTQYVRYVDHNSNSSNKKGILSTFPLIPFLRPGRGELVQAVKYHQQQKHNIVISAEHYTSRFPRNAESRTSHLERLFNFLFLREGGPAERVVAQPPNPKMSTVYRRSKKKKSQKSQNPPKRRRRLHRMKTQSPLTVSTEASTSAHDDDDIEPSDSGFDVDNIDESSRFAFDVKIVVAYRHYFQWLPSYYFQSQLINKGRNIPTLIDYIEEALKSLGDEYFFDGENAMNMVWSQAIPTDFEKFHGTLYSYLTWSYPPSLRNRVEIFDLHQQQIVINPNNETLQEEEPDLFCEFVCQALPAAPETCLHLRFAEKKPVRRVRKKSGPVSCLETGELSDTQLYQLRSAAKSNTWLKRISVSTKSSSVSTKFYDWTRQRKNATSDDGHRLLCLSDESTLALKVASWNMLRHLEALVQMRDEARQEGGVSEQQELFKAPETFRSKYPLLLSPKKYDHHVLLQQNRSESNLNQKDEDWWAPIKLAHDDLFDQTVESGAYCELDLDRLFADEDFLKKVFTKK